MGKKQIKKNLKKSEIEKDVQTHHGEEKSRGYKFFIIVLVIMIVIFGSTYGIIYYLMQDASKEASQTDTSSIEDFQKSRLENYSILAQDTFDKNGEYVVIFINGDEGIDEASTYLNSFEQGLGETVKMPFIVDLSEGVNSKYLFDDSAQVEEKGKYATIEYNKEPKTNGELQIYKYPTFIEIKDGSFVSYTEGEDFYEKFGIENPNAAPTS